jgi:hypothetical protein
MFLNLTLEQRTCIANKVKADPTIMSSLKKCHQAGEGMTCVKAIPALASCFA